MRREPGLQDRQLAAEFTDLCEVTWMVIRCVGVNRAHARVRVVSTCRYGRRDDAAARVGRISDAASDRSQLRLPDQGLRDHAQVLGLVADQQTHVRLLTQLLRRLRHRVRGALQAPRGRDR